MNRRVAVRAIIIHDGKFLAVKLHAYKDSIKGDFWCTIGGGVDPGEPLIPALTREVVEETGVHPLVGNLLYVQQFISGEQENLEFFFHVTNSEDFLAINLENTTHGSKEISDIRFISPASENLLPKFLKTEKFNNLETQQTKFFSNL